MLNTLVSLVTSNNAVKFDSNCLFMTCQVLLTGPDGSSIEACCLLANALSASFVSECIAQSLCLPRSFQSVCISGIEGLSNCVKKRSVSQFTVSPIGNPGRRFSTTAIVVPNVTCDLLGWDCLSNLSLADSSFGQPG